MLENSENSSENDQKSPKNAENTLTVEKLTKLQQRYPIGDGFAHAADYSSFTFWSYDFVGNRLKITIKAGEDISYKETPFAQTKELYWDDEAGMHKYREKGGFDSAAYGEEEAPSGL